MTKPSLPRELQGIPGVVLERKHNRWVAVRLSSGTWDSRSRCGDDRILGVWQPL